jgi:hypothetical protein
MANEEPSASARVTAVFPDSTLRFDVAPNTSLEELCRLLGSYAKGHPDPLFVEVTLPSASAGTVAMWGGGCDE